MSRRREFSVQVKREAWTRCRGHCEGCTAPLRAGGIEYDHRIPDAMGGDPSLDNCVVLCRTCHRLKTFGQDVPQIAQAKRRGEKHFGMRKSKASFGTPGLRRRMDGTVERRSS